VNVCDARNRCPHSGPPFWSSLPRTNRGEPDSAPVDGRVAQTDLRQSQGALRRPESPQEIVREASREPVPHHVALERIIWRMAAAMDGQPRFDDASAGTRISFDQCTRRAERDRAGVSKRRRSRSCPELQQAPLYLDAVLAGYDRRPRRDCAQGGRREPHRGNAPSPGPSSLKSSQRHCRPAMGREGGCGGSSHRRLGATARSASGVVETMGLEPTTPCLQIWPGALSAGAAS
jgi:hypothetical protein